MGNGELHLIPNRISDDSNEDDIPLSLYRKIHELKYWVVENLKATRRYLKSLDKRIDIDAMHFLEMNKRVDSSESLEALSWLRAGHDVGIMSDAGLPGIADPGNELILKAHQENIAVVPHAGSSSILLGLIASGLNGQRFMFHGYLPVKAHERKRALQEIEKQSSRQKASQIFMETPYRNDAVFATMMESLSGNTWLCVACDIDAGDAFLRTLRVKTWRAAPNPVLHKRPAVFIVQAFDEN
ncbi:MAG: SAM-dependent methyltransferase [Bacteroidota bacterium]